jgi:CHAT domain-containing protein/tetratricopeptide (TPR) repeat protein
MWSESSSHDHTYLLLTPSFLPVAREGSLVLLIAALVLVGYSSQALARSPNTARSTEEALQQETSTIGLGHRIERELKGGERHSFQVHSDAGQFLYVLVDQRGIDVVVTLFEPGGQPVLKVDSPNSNHGPEPLVAIVEKSGDYVIEVSAPNKNAGVGRYEISFVALREATPTDKEHVAADKAFWEGNRLRLQRTAISSRNAIEKYKQALPFFQSSGDHYRQALTLTVISAVYAGLGEFQRSLEYNEQALPLFRALKDRFGESATLNSIGGVYDVLGDLPKALEYYRQALLLLERGKATDTEGAILSNIGKSYNDLSDWQNALEYYRQALSIFRVTGEKRREAITLNNIGVAYSRLGEREKSLDYYQQALSLRQSIGDKPGEASTLTSIGQLYASSGEVPKALEFYRQALALRKTAGDRLGEATTIDYIGIAFSSMGEREKALGYHQQALELRRVTGDLRGEAHTLSNLGYVYNASGDAPKAIDFYNQSVVLFRRVGDRQNEASALYGLARVERNTGNVSEARHHIEAALSLFEDVRANAGAEQLRASYFASNQGAYQFYIGLLMEMHRLEPTRGHDALALQTSERARARSLLEMLVESRADIRQGVDPALLERERNLKQEINAKAQRQMQLTGQKSSEQRLAQLNKDISALEDEHEQLQAELRRRSPAYAALTQPHPLGLKDIQQQLEPNTLLLEYSLGDERSYLWVVTQNSMKTYELPKQEQIQKVALQVYESLTARSVVKSLETLAQRQTRIVQADIQFQRTASELSQMILAPAAAELGTKRLVVVADGALQYVPFAALSVGSSQLSVAKGRAAATGPWTTDHGQLPNYRPLILDHEVVSLPSASALAVQRQTLANRKRAAKAIALIADPVFSTSDVRFKARARALESGESASSQTTSADATRILEHLPGSSTGQLAIRRLPFTRQEAEQILAVSPATSNLKALDFRANRSIATSGELSNYRYVHFATHAYLDTERAGLSAIVLSLVDEEGKPQDGFLRTHDIYNLKLPAELVVLSACETGLGKDVKGEGLDGLMRGFMYAGARRVVVSLWNVNDKATAGLMQRMYTGILKNNKTPAASLRAAQIEMLRVKQWQSPYYWAAFVMQGEWK